VKEKSWEEHLESREHQFRLEMIADLVKENKEKYGHPFLVDATKEVRKSANASEKVDFS
jgi:hypothetical protein